MSGGLMEMARASWWHSTFLRAAGAKIGRGVYFDTMSFSVCSHPPPPGCLTSKQFLVTHITKHAQHMNTVS